MSKKKVLVGLSGGVDSSVSALLLKEQGYEVHALFMKNWDDDDGSPYCSAKEDFMDAVFISEQLNIHLEQVSFSKEYKDNVFSYFLKALRGRFKLNPTFSQMDIALSTVVCLSPEWHTVSKYFTSGFQLKSKYLERNCHHNPT